MTVALVLTRVIQREKSELHPLVVIFGVLTGGQIAEITRSFLSVAVLASLRIVYRQLQRSPWIPGSNSTSPTQIVQVDNFQGEGYGRFASCQATRSGAIETSLPEKSSRT